MAQRVHVELVDDLDGSAAEETVTFGLDGKHYEIDLNGKNAAKIRKVLSLYLDSARQVRNGKVTKSRGSNNNSEIREWARAQGYDVSTRGVIPKEIREAYAAAK